MKKYIFTMLALLLTGMGSLQAQKVWTEPAEDINPDDTLKIYVDLTKMDCDKLVGSAGPLYIWSWLPADPVNGNGDWTASNTDNALENVGPDIWRFTMIPTEFYGVSAQDVFDNDIHFLVKGIDGGSGGDCSAAGSENKTEDLMVEVDPPTGGLRKVYSFPDVVAEDTLALTQRDVFTLFYDNSIEDKPSMQNPGELYVYARAFDTDGTEYRPSALSQVGNNPDLQMTQDGMTYHWMIQPKALFAVPDGKTLDYLQLRVIKKVLVNSDDAVDGTFFYYFRCD